MKMIKFYKKKMNVYKDGDEHEEGKREQDEEK
jgi:hypothetical protein